jgi:hypothetical protein
MRGRQAIATGPLRRFRGYSRSPDSISELRAPGQELPVIRISHELGGRVRGAMNGVVCDADKYSRPQWVLAV